MGGGAETMYNQITFIFRKEWHGNILSIHLTKFRKSEKWKNKKLNFVNESYIYCSQAIIFQNNWSVYCIPILWICRQLKHHQLTIRNEAFILLEIILNAFNLSAFKVWSLNLHYTQNLRWLYFSSGDFSMYSKWN